MGTICVSSDHREFTIETHRDQIGYEAGEPDPDWRFVDGEGHEHRWQVVDEMWTVPTTEYREHTEWLFDDDDGSPYQIELGEYRCKLCDQEIHAGYRVKRQIMLGPEEWFGSFTCTPAEAAVLSATMSTLAGTIEIGDWNKEGFMGAAIITSVDCGTDVPIDPTTPGVTYHETHLTPRVEFHGQGPLLYSPP